MDNSTRVVKISRKNGRVVQDCDVYIGRRWTKGGWYLLQSKWANPYSVAICGSNEEAVAAYRRYICESRPDLIASIGELRGKVLGCWCKPGPCHGDVLVELLEKKTQ